MTIDEPRLIPARATEAPALTADQENALHCAIYCAMPDSADITQAVLDTIKANIVAATGWSGEQADTLAELVIPSFTVEAYRAWAVFGVDEPSNCAPCDCIPPIFAFKAPAAGRGTMTGPDVNGYFTYTPQARGAGEGYYCDIAATLDGVDCPWAIDDIITSAPSIDFSNGFLSNLSPFEWYIGDNDGHCYNTAFQSSSTGDMWTIQIKGHLC